VLLYVLCEKEKKGKGREGRREGGGMETLSLKQGERIRGASVVAQFCSVLHSHSFSKW